MSVREVRMGRSEDGRERKVDSHRMGGGLSPSDDGHQNLCLPQEQT